MLQTLIFDWDGTLHDTKRLYGMAFRKAYSWLVENALAPERYYSDEETSIYLGMSAPQMWESFMPELDAEKKKIASGMIGAEMDRLIGAGEARLYEGVPEVLEKLKSSGYRLVILSNCRHAYLEEHRRVFGLDRYFDGYYAAEDYGFAPKEEIFVEIKKTFSPGYAVIGDRNSDIKTAQVHGLHSIGCSYGFGSAGELDAAEYRIDDIRRLPDVLELMDG